ncbi:MAG: hypothetical protein KF729_10535 [Sandaracinaceae bacterium]|nr:hypothetical protein [Sandaracinaceae bacterium]
MCAARISPPYLELAFYVGKSEQVQGLVSAIDLLVASGASQTGAVEYDLRSEAYRQEDHSLDEVKAAAGRCESMRVQFQGASQITPCAEQLEVDRGILLFRTEAEALCGDHAASRRGKRSVGAKAYRLFVAMADALDPLYGAISIEYSLERPDELRRDIRSLAFRTFYLSESRLGQRLVADALNACGDGVYVERLRRGVYISMSDAFNPKRREISSLDSQHRSVEVAKILLRAF